MSFYRVSVFDVLTGRVVRTFTPTATINGGAGVVAVGHTRRVIVATGSSVHVLDARQGQVLHTTAVGAATFGALAVDQRTGHVFVASYQAPVGASTLTALDAASGRILHSIGVGLQSYHGGISMPSWADPAGVTVASL